MSAIDGSVTLDDVFGVVEARRVPLAPELAGYLALEIADHTDPGGGDVDPQTVHISDEGTVALVRLKSNPAVGDAESSVRALLAKLLEASGSQTPALSAAAKRRTPAGLPSLVEELEAALIPVNRAAGRRALARLAREVKRVTLGVGRNASTRSSAPPPPRRAVAKVVAPAPRAPSISFEDEAATVKRSNPLTESAPAPEVARKPTPAPPAVREPTPAPPPVKRDDVEELLASFDVKAATDREMSRDLKAIAGLSPTPPPPDAKTIAELTKDLGRTPAPRPDDSVEELLALADASGPVMPDEPPPPTVAPNRGRVEALAPPLGNPRTEPITPTPPPSTARGGRADRDAEARPTRETDARRARDAEPPAAIRRTRDVPSGREPRAPKTGFFLLLLALVALVGIAIAIGVNNPQLFSGRKVAPPVPSASSSAGAASVPSVSRCKVSLALSGVPSGAEILLRMGQTPLDIERMPVGTRLEFVATAEGHVPRRAIVRADAVWDRGADGKARIDVPIQLDPSKVKPGAIDPWPAAEPGSEVGGTGAPGTVHAISNVRGAEVWLLAGLGPEARIEQLRCDAEIDVLLAGPPGLRRRLHVSREQIEAAPLDPADTTGQGVRLVTLSAR